MKAYAYDDALVQYQKALDLAKKEKQLEGQARSLKNLGDSLRYSRTLFGSAIEFYEQGLEDLSRDRRATAKQSL